MPQKKRIKSVHESGRIMSSFKRNSTSEDANESEPPSDLTAKRSDELQYQEDASDESGDNEADTRELKMHRPNFNQSGVRNIIGYNKILKET